ncbi:MAG TPA: GntR family transcriptional regulator [Stellaceae bacterium]|jgi:GntR family transcriptional regulator|nr:GntR family transcriptional regulator [Stellaceae bacterium]
MAKGLPDFRPLYAQVASLLTERIGSGQWKPGAPLPSEIELAEELKVSQGTVRKALGEMEARNLLVRQQGRGTFVAQHSAEATLFRFFPLVDAAGAKPVPTSIVLAQKTGRAERREAAALALAPRSLVHRILRLRRIAGRTVVVERITLSAALFAGLALPIGTEIHEELYVIYEQQFGITVVRADEELRAVPAAAADARHLGLAPGTPLLEVRRIARDLYGAPVELRIDRCDTSGHCYANTLT